MLVLCIKGRLPYGTIIVLYDLGKKQYVGPEMLVLEKSDKPEVFARQLASAVGQLEKMGNVVGITGDLRELCDQHEIPLNVEWETYATRK